jgi:hypothetical protein
VTNYVYTHNNNNYHTRKKERKKGRKKFIPTEKHGRNKDQICFPFRKQKARRNGMQKKGDPTGKEKEKWRGS